MKKTVAILLALMMILSMVPVSLAESSNQIQMDGFTFNKTGYPIVENGECVIKVFHELHSECKTWDDLSFMKELSDLTGITFEYVPVSNVEFAEKKNLSLISGDYPDVYWCKLSNDELYTYGVEGQVLTDYTALIDEYMPNLKATYEKVEGLENSIKQIDGKIYALPYIVETATNAETNISYRADLAAKVGVTEKPKTIEEFEAMLVAMKNGLGEDFVPMLINSSMRADYYFFTSFGEEYDVDWSFKDGKLGYNRISEQYRRYLSWMNKLFSEGLLDAEHFSGTSDQRIAKLNNHLIGVCDMEALYTADSFRSEGFQLEPLQPLDSEYSTDNKLRAHNTIELGYAAIPVTCKYPEVVARLFDIMFSEEMVGENGLNSLSLWLGLYGTDWVFTESDGQQTYARQTPADAKVASNLYAHSAVCHFTPPGYLYLTALPDEKQDPAQYALGRSRTFGVHAYQAWRFPDAFLLYTEDEMDVYSKFVDISTYVTNMRAQFITGTASLEKDWDDFVKNVEKMGIQDVMDVMMNSYNRMYGG